MEILKLLEQASAAGFTVRVEGDQLVVRGPRGHEAFVHALAARKDEVIAVLRRTHHPAEPCFACGGVRFWQRSDGGWVCATCHPAPVEHIHEVIIARQLRDELARACWKIAEVRGFAPLAIDRSRTVDGGRAAWTAFTRHADVPMLRLVLSRLRQAIEREVEADLTPNAQV